MRGRFLGAALLAPLLAIIVPAAAQPANDDCANATAISGSGVFSFTNVNATTGPEGQNNSSCAFQGVTSIRDDVWFCWTADCTGNVSINTCGQTGVDTKIAVYDGCACPDPAVPPVTEAICCNDDACDLQSNVNCDVICGHQYLIQIGSGFQGTLQGSGTFEILCMGEPCGEPCETVPGQCCAGRPAFTAADYAPFGETVAVTTASPIVLGGAVLEIIDLNGLPLVPTGSNQAQPMYSDPTWTAANLGSIFGLTLDADGNIYTTATTVYSSDMLGAAGTGSYGDVYRIDGVTGAISVFATLPQGSDPANGPGLGQIEYDCTNDQFFVSNFEDGIIYRLDSSGAVLSTFDHDTADDGDDGFPPLGDRPWGLAVHNERLYYGLWVENAGAVNIMEANQVWSISIAGGDFTGAAQSEIDFPPVVNPYTNPSNLPYSNPVSDIRFTPEGHMLVAERGMANDFTTTAHQARALEYVCVDGAWVPGNLFTIGVSHPEGNSAGGIDVDFASDGRVWVMGDALQFSPQYVYGIQGLPLTGGDVTNSHIIDINGNVAGLDKNQLGDVDIPCSTACVEITDEHIDCPTDGSSDYVYTFELTNISGTDASWLLLPTFATQPNDNSVTISPNVIALPPLLGDGSNSATIMLTISGADPGEEVCFDFTLADENVDVCCAGEHCVTIPECDCLEIKGESFSNVECDAAGNVSFDWTITVTNFTGAPIEHSFLISQTPGAMFMPEHHPLGTIPNFGTATFTSTVTGVTPGQVVCLQITAHDASLNECCAIVHCFTAPDCDPPFGACALCDGTCFEGPEDECLAVGGYYCGDAANCDECGPPTGACCLPDGTCADLSICECEPAGGVFYGGETCLEVQCPAGLTCPGDCDGDGLVNVTDLVMVVLDWGPCVGDCPSDFDGNGSVDVGDLVDVILHWGPCP